MSLTGDQRRAFYAFAKIRAQFTQSLLAVASAALSAFSQSTMC
jgi:hypothetical protein